MSLPERLSGREVLTYGGLLHGLDQAAAAVQVIAELRPGSGTVGRPGQPMQGIVCVSKVIDEFVGRVVRAVEAARGGVG